MKPQRIRTDYKYYNDMVKKGWWKITEEVKHATTVNGYVEGLALTTKAGVFIPVFITIERYFDLDGNIRIN